MKKRIAVLVILVSSCPLAGPVVPLAAQQQKTRHIRVDVNMVQLNVAVTDNKGNYVTGLQPQDFVVTEDGIGQTIATFAGGDAPIRRVADLAQAQGQPEVVARSAAGPPQSDADATTLNNAIAGANVFVLFDKSNYMYRGFVFAQDAIADFIRSLDRADRIAFYSYSRDLTRGATLTADQAAVLRGVRSTTAGDNA